MFRFIHLIFILKVHIWTGIQPVAAGLSKSEIIPCKGDEIGGFYGMVNGENNIYYDFCLTVWRPYFVASGESVETETCVSGITRGRT